MLMCAYARLHYTTHALSLAPSLTHTPTTCCDYTGEARGGHGCPADICRNPTANTAKASTGTGSNPTTTTTTNATAEKAVPGGVVPKQRECECVKWRANEARTEETSRRHGHVWASWILVFACSFWFWSGDVWLLCLPYGRDAFGLACLFWPFIGIVDYGFSSGLGRVALFLM